MFTTSTPPVESWLSGARASMQVCREGLRPLCRNAYRSRGAVHIPLQSCYARACGMELCVHFAKALCYTLQIWTRFRLVCVG